MACEEGSIVIPQDIITSILYRLPVKSLCRFRCVSKEWQTLFSEPHFIKTHTKTLNRTHLIFWCDGLDYSVPFSNHEAVSALMKHLPELSRFIFGASANGLVLASGFDVYRNVHTFVFLNLITKDYVELPNYLRCQKGYEDALGFGYDSMTDDYKVVTIFHTKLSLTYPSIVYVYSLRTCTWRQLSDSPYPYSWRPEGVFVNGFIHWIAWKASDHIPVIVAFSLADETFSEVASPNLYNNGHEVSLGTCRLVALGDKLAIFNGDKRLVWLMNEYGVEKSWTKIVFYGYNKVTMINPENLFATDDLTRIYYLEEGSLPKSGDIFNINLYRVVSTFVESLVSPKLNRAN